MGDIFSILSQVLESVESFFLIFISMTKLNIILPYKLFQRITLYFNRATATTKLAFAVSWYRRFTRCPAFERWRLSCASILDSNSEIAFAIALLWNYTFA